MDGGTATITAGPPVQQHWAENSFVPRHLHVAPYAAVVIAGRYEECGWLGRSHTEPGTVLMHGRFDSHLDRFHRRAQILNLELKELFAETPRIGRIDDVDALVRLAERDPAEAGRELVKRLRPAGRRATADWPELLAQELKAEKPLDVRVWAHRFGIAPETATRGFARVFGVTPARFRSEWRCRRALLAITSGRVPLSGVAIASGFADQSHMTRQIHAMTGRTPGQWCRIGRS